MRFHFKNIGPIDAADLELGDLTIIAGRNNTGKTYLVYTMYGFLRTWTSDWHRPLSENLLREFGDFLGSEVGSRLSVDRSHIERLRRRTIEQAASRFSEMRISHIFSSPPSLYMEAGHKRHGPGREAVELIRLTGGHVPPDVALGLCNMFPRALIGNFYGSNEAQPAWSCRLYTRHELATVDDRLGIGRGAPWSALHTVSDDGDEVDVGVWGNLEFRLAAGISPRQVAEEELRYNPKGRAIVAMGDVGFVDETGERFVMARRLETVERGTRRVLLSDVEAVLRKYERIRDVAVVSLPDRTLGEEVGALVVGDHLDEDEISRYCSRHLERYMIPRFIKSADQIPRKRTRKGDNIVDVKAVIALIRQEARTGGVSP